MFPTAAACAHCVARSALVHTSRAPRAYLSFDINPLIDLGSAYIASFRAVSVSTVVGWTELTRIMSGASSSARRMAWLRPWPRAAPVMKATFPATRPGLMPPYHDCDDDSLQRPPGHARIT